MNLQQSKLTKKEWVSIERPVPEDEISILKMITEGYAWDYDGGTKQKNFEELREIRRSFGPLDQG